MAHDQKESAPSLATMTAGLVRTAARVARDGLRGDQMMVSDEESLGRKAICQACEFFERGTRRCGKCGCFVSLKVQFKAASCPMGHWAPSAPEPSGADTA
jgi:Family of unknown function (DUF6171)